MRAVFLFPPKASPTYIPLGLAALLAYVQRTAPHCSVDVRDLNLETWTWLAGKDPSGEALLSFVQGRQGDFYDESAYGVHRETWRRLGAGLAGLARQACRYTDSGEASPEFLELLDRMRTATLRTDPELVGISVLFLDQIPFALALARRIREGSGPGLAAAAAAGRAPGPRIVLGGAALSALRAGELLRICPWIDAVLLGEGEAGAAALCNGRAFTDIPGAWVRNARGPHRNPTAPALSLETLPRPDFTPFGPNRYFNPTPVLPTLFSRGCRWRKCRFCSHNASFGGYRSGTVPRFVDEMERAGARHMARHVYLADQYVDAEDMEKMADEIIARKGAFSFHVMGRPTEAYTPQRLDKMYRAGCRWICWGVETGSQRLLDLCGKGTDVTVVERVIRQSARAGISNLLMMIFGLPTSSETDLRQTFRFLENVYPSTDALSASSFVLWAHTPFARSAPQLGLHVSGAEEILRIQGAPLHSHRLKYLETGTDGSLRPPGGPQEVIQWERRRRWMGEASFLEHLPCEHYLLYAARRAQTHVKPRSPYRRAA